jgi:hypothetical protein
MKKLQKTPELEEKVKKLSLGVGDFKTGGLRRGGRSRGRPGKV